MHKRGHVGMTAILYSPIAYTLAYYNYTMYAIAGLIAIWFFAGLPDIDMKLPKVTHRGPVTHSVFSSIGMTILTGTLLTLISHTYTISTLTNQTILFISLLMGFIFLAHLAGDIITYSGIAPLAPIKNTNITLNLCGADSIIFNWLFFLTGIILTLLAIALGTGLIDFQLINM